MLDRRGFLGVVAAVTAIGAARLLRAPGPRVPQVARSAVPGGQAKAVSAGPDASLSAADVRAGARFGACTVQSVTTTEDGALSVGMRDSGGRLFELELLAHDDRTPGVARAGEVGVYVYNHGTGDKATHEEHGLSAMALARHLRRRQAAGARMPPLPTLAARTGRTMTAACV